MVPDVVGVIWFITPLLGWISIGTWVYLDATNRGMKAPFLWTVATFVFFPMFIWYLYVRRRTDPSSSPGWYQRTAATVGWAIAIATIGMAVSTPPDPLTQMAYYPFILAVAFIAMYVLVYRANYKGIWQAARE